MQMPMRITNQHALSALSIGRSSRLPPVQETLAAVSIHELSLRFITHCKQSSGVR